MSFIRLRHFGELSDCPDFYLRSSTVLSFQLQYDDVFTVKTAEKEYLCQFCIDSWDDEGEVSVEVTKDESLILNMLR